MAKPKRKRTAAEKKARQDRKRDYVRVFINGKQIWQKRELEALIDGLPVDEFIARNADPIWLHQNEMRELLEEFPYEGLIGVWVESEY